MDIKVYLKYSKIQWLMIDTTIFPCLTAINWGSKGSKPRTDRQTHPFLFIRSASEEGDELMNAQISRTVNGQVRCTAQMDWAPGEFMIEWVHFLHASSKKNILMFWNISFLGSTYLIYLREFCVPFQILGTGDHSSWRLQILGWSLNWLVKQLGWDPANGSLQMMAPLACWLEGKHRSISLK